jgi:hypothetical protein
MHLPFRCRAAAGRRTGEFFRCLYAAFGRSLGRDAPAADSTSILLTMPDTMSDSGRQTLGGNAHTTSIEQGLGDWSGDGMALLTLLTRPTQRYATQRTLPGRGTDLTTLHTRARVPERGSDAVDDFAGCRLAPHLLSSPARRVDFSRQTARFRFWNTPFSVLLGGCHANATGDATNATDATGTQRLPRPIGGITTSAV